MNNYSYCAIAFFLPKEYLSLIVNSSRDLGVNFGSWYILSEHDFPPHITSWIAYIPSLNIDNLISNASEIISKQKASTIFFGNIHIQDSGYVSIEVLLDNFLVDLHNNLLRYLNNCRNGYIPEKYLSKINEYSSEQQESIMNYGTRMAGKFYNPHVTIGVVKKEFVAEVKKNLFLSELRGKEFFPNELVLFRQKDEGKSIEILRRFNFST